MLPIDNIESKCIKGYSGVLRHLAYPTSLVLIMEGTRVNQNGGRKQVACIVYFTDMHRTREESYRKLHTNARFIPYLRTIIIVFVLNHNCNKMLEYDWLSPAMI